MDAFVWNPCFITGLAEVDEQHRRLVDLINRFGELVTRPQGASTGEIDAVYAELERYAQYHFTEEEALMAAKRLDARHIAQHERAHAGFLAEVTRLRESMSASNSMAAKSLLDFLTHWLAYHILGCDRVMAQQMALIEAGRRPEAAALAGNPAGDPATEALLGALNGLFQQVSERNRELERINRTLEARVAERTRALHEANLRLEDLANTDALTALPNRRAALRCLTMAWEAALRDGAPLACMMIDADGFKQINDSHGHDAGDAVLRALAQKLRDSVRSDDVVCRLGGDEFLVICPGTPLAGALGLAEALRAEVAGLRVAAGSGQWAGSISVGVAARSPAMQGMEDLIKAADAGVYRAKRAGRDRVAHAPQA